MVDRDEYRENGSSTETKVPVVSAVKASKGMRKVSIGGILGAPDMLLHPGMKTRIKKTSSKCIIVLPMLVFINVLLRAD